MKRGVRGSFQATADILLVLHHPLLTTKPKGHLWELIFEVRRRICLFCHVNMEAFGILSIEVVSSAEKLDEFQIVTNVMELWYIEVSMNIERNKDITVVMKGLKCVIHLGQCFRGMYRISSKVDEIEHSTDCTNQSRIRMSTRKTDVSDEGQKKTRNLVMLGAGYTREMRDSVHE